MYAYIFWKKAKAKKGFLDEKQKLLSDWSKIEKVYQLCFVREDYIGQRQDLLAEKEKIEGRLKEICYYR